MHRKAVNSTSGVWFTASPVPKVALLNTYLRRVPASVVGHTLC